jgi:hypothetical protein
MAQTLTALLAAYLLADFVFQTQRGTDRPRLLVIALHALAVAGLSYLALGRWNGPLLGYVLFSQIAKDIVLIFFPRNLAVFFASFGLHLLLVVVVAALYPDATLRGWWMRLPAAIAPHYWRGLCLLTGILACLPTGGLLINKLMEPLTSEIATAEIAGLRHGALYIGWLERTLVMVLIMINQPAGVGFLITAKSILRFGDVKDSSQRMATEYIIIGTFMSFGWGLLVAVLTQSALSLFHP